MKKVNLFWLLGAATVLGVVVPTIDYHFITKGDNGPIGKWGFWLAMGCILWLVVAAILSAIQKKKA